MAPKTTTQEPDAQSFLEGVRNMVRVSKPAHADRKHGTAMDRRSPILSANNRVASEVELLTANLRVVDPNFIAPPFIALIKSLTNDELLALSAHIQGYMLTHRGVGKSQFARDTAALIPMAAEKRSQLIAMHNAVTMAIDMEGQKGINILIENTLMLTDDPISVEAFGEYVTRSKDARAHKWGAVGSLKRLVQQIQDQQRKWYITQATKKIASGKARPISA